MSIEELFTRYGSPVETAEINIRSYLHRPDRLKTADEIMRADKTAADLIKRCEAMIERMQEYRQAVTARYGELETMNYREEIRLNRWHRNGGIVYNISAAKIYSDGTETSKQIEHYSGKDRHKAIAHFERLCKETPAAIPVKDIAKQRWER